MEIQRSSTNKKRKWMRMSLKRRCFFAFLLKFMIRGRKWSLSTLIRLDVFYCTAHLCSFSFELWLQIFKSSIGSLIFLSCHLIGAPTTIWARFLLSQNFWISKHFLSLNFLDFHQDAIKNHPNKNFLFHKAFLHTI